MLTLADKVSILTVARDCIKEVTGDKTGAYVIISDWLTILKQKQLAQLRAQKEKRDGC